MPITHRASISPEYLEVRITGEAPESDAGEPVEQPTKATINGKEGWLIGTPLLMQPGVHRISVSGFETRKVTIRAGETDYDHPKLVEFSYADDAVKTD